MARHGYAPRKEGSPKAKISKESVREAHVLFIHELIYADFCRRKIIGRYEKRCLQQVADDAHELFYGKESGRIEQQDFLRFITNTGCHFIYPCRISAWNFYPDYWTCFY